MMDRIDRLLAVKRHQCVLSETTKYIDEARAAILAAIDTLGDIDENGSAVRGALHGALPDLDQALWVLRRQHGNCNRAIANIARVRRTGVTRTKATP